MSKIKIKGLNPTVTTSCFVELDDGQAEFAIKWTRPKMGGEKEALIKELSHGERALGRKQAEAGALIQTGDDNHIPAEFFDLLEQTEDQAEQHTTKIISSVKKYLIGWDDLTGEDEDGNECPVPFNQAVLEELLSDHSWQVAIVDAYRGLLGLRQKERDNKAKN